MSRIGKLPIAIPAGVKVSVSNDTVTVEGKGGKLTQTFETRFVAVSVADGALTVARHTDEKDARARHGLYRALFANMVKGVQEPYTKILQLVGLGYRSKVQGKVLELEIGFHDAVKYPLPEGITATVADQTVITLTSANKQLVGQVAAEIRALRKPEPYQGRGIRYKDEVIRRKEGKLAGGAGAAAKEG
ncbi:50S ribosomal protein L6 [Candidatus Acetothermia bacterium]|nr:50S ribosomal protein L6 [Candidatus Acetothermia bacterium]MBI3659195.1 50S ribosomal protein L6 [Candidatus Acetothermia bacterium]